MSVDGADVRVGDAERREVDQLLQRATGDGLLTLVEYDERSAAVWSARTRGQLTEVTKDLPTAPGWSAVPPTVARTGTSSKKPRWGVAIFSETRLGLDALPGQPLHAVAVMGHAVVDLRRESLPPETFVSATAVMGQVEVLVPAGVRVETNGISIMGGRDVKVGPAAPDAPLIRVHATSIMGGVEIRSPKSSRIGQLKEARQRRAAERAARLQARNEWTPGQQDRAVAHQERHLARRRHKRSGLISLAAAVVVVTGAGAVAAAMSGDSVGGFGDRTVQAVPGQTVKVGQFFGDVRVEVPPATCVNVVGTHWFGESPSNSSICGPGSGDGTVATVRVDGAFGDVKIDFQGPFTPTH